MRLKKRPSKWLWVVVFGTLLTALAFPASAAAKEVGPPKTAGETSGGIQRLAALSDITEAMERLVTALQRKEAALKSTGSPEERDAIKAEIAEIRGSLEKRREEFESMASGGGLEASEPTDDRPFNLQQEIQEILRPLVDELKSVTKRPREIEALRRRISAFEKTLQRLRDAVANVDVLLSKTQDPKLKKELSEAHARWLEKKEEIEREIGALQYQLDQKTANRTSVVKTLQEALSTFFRTRGLHLLLALFAFLAIFFLLRLLSWRIFRARAARTPGTRSFFHRIFQVLYHGFTVLAALAGALFLLYNFGDWMILSIALIVLLGVLWTARHGLSRFWEQSKLLLNIGTVREGERLIYEGIPWQVAAVNLQSTLKNEELRGGVVRLPLTTLIGRQSRPYDEEEPWFPTREGDYVTLADGTFGRVILQTPETVTLDVLGGCRKTYPSGSFLGQNPVNLSRNHFGVGMTFGLDYALQDRITGEIPEQLKGAITEGLAGESFGPDVLDVTVQFKEAGASSLDLFVWVSFSGAAAANYYAIGRVLQRLAVDACTANGWSIPFPQITVHQAGASGGIVPTGPA